MSGEKWALDTVIRRPDGRNDVVMGKSETIPGRPLLVLDPDNPGQMTEFWTALVEASCFHASDMAHVVRAMLPKPLISKPDEPMGLGAVVDDGGKKWILIWTGEPGGVWQLEGESDRDRRLWSDFPDTVTVLSEGVS
jgi:hypothetical protein